MKFHTRVLPVLLIGLSASLAAQADCPQPATPTDIPNGRDAREPELVAAMQSVREYSTRVDAYLQCLDEATKQNRLSVLVAVKLHNEAVDELQTVANRFNAQLRTYRSRTG